MAVEIIGLFPISIRMTHDSAKKWDRDTVIAELTVLVKLLEEKGFITNSYYDNVGLTNKGLALRLVDNLNRKSSFNSHMIIGFASDSSRGTMNYLGVGMEVGVWDSDGYNHNAKTILSLDKMSVAINMIRLGNPVDDMDEEQLQINKMKKEIGI